MRDPVGLLGEVRLAVDLPIECPAGAPIGETIRGSGCRCRITGSNVMSGTDPSSLASYCLNPDPVHGYGSCPAWREEKRRTWEDEPSLVGLPSLE